VSWAQLIAIKEEMRRTAQEERERDPVACPNCGQPLEYHAGKNMLHCPSGDFQVYARYRRM